MRCLPVPGRQVGPLVRTSLSVRTRRQVTHQDQGIGAIPERESSPAPGKSTPTYSFSRIAACTFSAVIGRSRIFTPTASLMALAMAGALGVMRFSRCI